MRNPRSCPTTHLAPAPTVRWPAVPKKLRVQATLEPRGPAGAFVLTDEQVASLGEGRKAFPVRLTVNGSAHPLRLARMGGENVIGMSKAARAAAGVEIGSSYAVVVELDGDARTIEVPGDLAKALTAGKVEKAFAA